MKLVAPRNHGTVFSKMNLQGLMRGNAESRAAYYRTLWSTILSGEVFHSTVINLKKSGETYYAEQTITPMRDESGNVSHFVAVCKDMTDRRMRDQQEFELRMAAAVQERLYPQAPPLVSGIEVGATCQPASATCGDYYDFIERPDGSLCIVIGDVCGHGVAPALIMVATRAYLRVLLATELGLGEVMTQLNKTLMGDLRDEDFVTLLLVRIEPRTRELTFVNAGHPAAAIFDVSGQCRLQLEYTGMALGFSEEARYECSAPVHLCPNELLLMVTDGILESRAPDGSFFAMQRLLQLIHSHHTLPISEALGRLRKDLAEFVQHTPPEDDQTVILCRVCSDDASPQARAQGASRAEGQRSSDRANA